ncbi:MAG: plasmid mobilization relaxosome protein MobC [Alcanivorax sp.]
MSAEKPSPFCLRLSKEERERLEYEAGDMPLGTYVRSRLFDDPTPRKRRMKRPVKDHEILAQLLTKLGSSRIANNLNQLARAANSGSLLLMPEIEEDLRQALSDIVWMRKILMQGLGLYQNGGDNHDT